MVPPSAPSRQEPYRNFAAIYDRVMGDAVFPTIKETFELAVRRYGIRFRSAADLGCGTGRFLCYLARYGVPLWGVDSSPAMLRRAAARNRYNAVSLLRQDITRLNLPRPVDLLTCNFDTVNYLLSEGELGDTFHRCRGNLTAGGHFVFDCIAGSAEGGGWRRETQSMELPGVVTTWRIAWNPVIGRSEVLMEYLIRDGSNRVRRCQELHRQRWYPLGQLVRLLSRANLQLLGVHDAETFAPATADTFWVKCIARKS